MGAHIGPEGWLDVIGVAPCNRAFRQRCRPLRVTNKDLFRRPVPENHRHPPRISGPARLGLRFDALEAQIEFVCWPIIQEGSSCRYGLGAAVKKRSVTEFQAAKAGIFRIGGGLEVNRMGFGAMRIVGPGTWGPRTDIGDVKRLLRRVVELGVNFIDTADAYGPGLSERLIAGALYPYPPGLVIATKGGVVQTGPGQARVDGTPSHLRRSVEGSLARLRKECIDLYQLHVPDPKVPITDSVGALADMADEGKIRRIGICNVSLDQYREVREVASIASVQNRYNLQDRSAADLVETAMTDGVAFIPWAPLRRSKLLEAAESIGRIATEVSATESQIILAWLLKRAPNILLIPGTGSLVHLEENIAAAELVLSDRAFDQLSLAR